MQVPVGPHRYTLTLEPDYIDLEGEPVLGLCDSDRQVIRISAVAPPAKRLTLFWHELGHAWLRELDVHESHPYPQVLEPSPAFDRYFSTAPLESQQAGVSRSRIVLIFVYARH